MPTRLEDKAVERSTFGIKVSFNEVSKVNGVTVLTPITPNAGLKWSLVDGKGTIVNSKEDMPLVPAESVVITLYGDDLALPPGGNSVFRYVTVEGTYNGAAGNDLPIVDEVSFQIVNVKGAP